MDLKYTVSICVICYNQADYIEETLNGILNQKVNFAVELILSNDCSTDNTDKIITEISNNYHGKISIRYINHQKNIGMMPNFISSLEKCNGKYIALCDGDDYWVDENKLQRQVDFLDNNLEFSLIHTNVYGRIENQIIKEISLKKWNLLQEELSLKEALYFPIAFTSTSLFRNVKIPDKIKRDFLQLTSGDWGLWIFLTLKGKAKFMNYHSAVYRIDVGVSKHSMWEKNYLKRSIYLFRLIRLINSYNDKKDVIISICYYVLIYSRLNFIAKKIKPKFKF